jgi:hypothetical protein
VAKAKNQLPAKDTVGAKGGTGVAPGVKATKSKAVKRGKKMGK